LESLLLKRFDPDGPDRQTFDAVDVEDSHHRLLEVSVERLGTEQIEVPAGVFDAEHYQSERFGTTSHWLDENRVTLCWASESDTYRWELERYPAPEPLPRQTETVATGTYDVFGGSGNKRGVVSWAIERDDLENFRLQADEQLEVRTSCFEGQIDDQGKWQGSTETVHWTSGEGHGPPEIHHLEMFFYRERAHLLRFRDRAYPLLQSRVVASTPIFHLVNYPISAVFWLRNIERDTDREQVIEELAHIANRYRGGGLEVQKARVSYLGKYQIEDPVVAGSGHHFMLRYPGGWEDSTFEFWTDEHFVPLRLKMFAGEGELEYRLVQYDVSREGLLPAQ
jgi:hypothetical protein